MNDDFVSVRVLHDRHPTNWTFDSLRGETNVLFLQALDGPFEVLDLYRDARPISGRFPLVPHAADSDRGRTQFVFNPDAFGILTRDFQPKRSLVKSASTLHVG